MAKTKILIIAGHGAGDVGATAKIDGKTYYESTETRVMAKKLQSQLKKYKNVTVDLYPTNRNAYEDAKKCCLKKNFANYDYVIELHFNACVQDLSGNGYTTGTEIFVTVNDKSTKTETLITKHVSELGFKNRGVKKYNWTVINNAHKIGSESALFEICFIDDADDMRIYLSNKDKIATNTAKGIAESYGLKKKASSTKSATNSSTTTTISKETSSTNSTPSSTTKKETKPTVAKPTIKNGSKGTQVKYLQQDLNYLGFKGADGKKLTVDSIAGTNVVYALKQFQKKYGLEVDGVYGNNSYNKMKALLG